MSEDFIRGLEHDLVEAMERFERRPRRWPTGARLARLPRNATLARVAVAAATRAAVVVAAGNLARSPSPARPHVAAVLAIGGTPMDAVLAQGSLWASDFRGSIVRVDPRDRRVIARIKLPGAPEPVAASTGSVWVQSARSHCNGRLARIDASSGEIVARRPQSYPSEQPGALAAGSDGVWIKRGCAVREGVDRLDPAGAVRARVALASVDGVATAAGNLWVLGHDGTLTQVDAANGRVRQRWPGLAPLY